MSKIDIIKALINLRIRLKVDAESISPDDVADSLDAITDALYVNSFGVATVTTGNSFEAPEGTIRVYLDFSPALPGDFSLTLPPNPVDGDTVLVFIGGVLFPVPNEFGNMQGPPVILGALEVLANTGQTLIGEFNGAVNGTGVLAGNHYSWIYREQYTSWYRL